MARICVIRQEQALLDPRVVREVESLISAGHTVDLICERQPGERWRERRGPLTVLRLPSAPRGGLSAYATRYGGFLVAAGALVTLRHLRRRYDLVQANSLPDALVFAATIPRLLGTPVLLDLHECTPEFFMMRFGGAADHPAVRATAWLEQASIRFASAAITCTEPMRQRFVDRGAPGAKIDVVHNGPDETVFDPERVDLPAGHRDEFVLLSHGLIDDRHGLDTIVRAVALLEDLPHLRLVVQGAGPRLGDLERLVDDLGLSGKVTFERGWISFEELTRIIADADVGVVATRRDPFGDLTHCNKMYEYFAMRKPVIASWTRSVDSYFGDCLEMFTADDEKDLARAIRLLHDNPRRAEELVEDAAKAMEPYRWPRQREVYLGVVDRLLAGRRHRLG